MSWIAADAWAYPQEAARPTAWGEHSSITVDASAVAAATDRLLLQDYDVLKLAATHLPNERYRIEGAWLAANARWTEAAKQFRTAARYADKYSQHRLSMLYWHGVGVERDRVEAYVWADIAAERGYPQFLAIREKMWAELTPAEQAQVPARGSVRYAEFGDPTAKRRLNDMLAQAKRKITGSHTGFVGSLGVRRSTKNPKVQVNAFENWALTGLYRPQRLDPERYWAAEDIVWKKGHVTVGDLEATSLRRESATPPKTEPEPSREPTP
ncbi:MAG: sel1 repeat family protein [Xanthomonadaceae bacterium]|nr:sel1 repeat family protein [Xanthomonadaceae bacterium]